ncbi:MAG: helix-turn-helix domain-containing protein [Eubacterium sp.]|nr:helix-turn-helix domain-containing protein [Eubacterium sp.]
MLFSLWNFKDWFDREGIELSYMISRTAAEISALAFSSDAADREEETARIFSGDELTNLSGFHSVLQHESDRILFPTISPAEVWNYGNTMIEHYSEWETGLFSRIQKDHSPAGLFQEAQKEFPFPMAVFLKNGTIYQRTEDYDLRLPGPSVREILQHVLAGADDEPVCRSYRFNPLQTFLASPVYFGSHPAAVLVSYEKERRFQPGYFPVFRTIVSAVQTYYQYYSEMPQATHPLSAWFYQQLDQEARSVPDLDARLHECGWDYDDYYQIICIDAKPGCPPSVLQDASLQLTDTSHCCIDVNNYLAVLRHLGKSYPKQVSAFGSSVRALDECRAGISLPFHSLDAVAEYFRQAQWALHRAEQLHLDSLDTGSHLPAYIIDICQSLPDGRALIHPDILRLAEADAESTDELLKTLYTYYICGSSVTRASDSLFIHRNTMHLRLKKIHSILSGDPDDPRTAEQYLLSLLLLRK